MHDSVYFGSNVNIYWIMEKYTFQGLQAHYK